MKSAKAAIEATKVVSLPRAQQRREKDELAFLPAALEIVETPPSPIGRAIGATLIALFCLALVWASFGHVDIVASAPGKILPSGRVKLIQPFETGVVRALHIRDGQSVKAGDVLIELDPTMTTADEEHIRNDFVAAQLDIARLRAELSENADPESEFHPPAGRESRPRRHGAAVPGQADRRIPGQARLARSPAHAEGGRTRDYHGDNQTSLKPTNHSLRSASTSGKASSTRGSHRGSPIWKRSSS